MKSILKNTAIQGTSLFILAQLILGLKVSGGLATFILGGFVLSIMSQVVKPILNIISLPLNFITLGMSSFLVNALVFYLVTILVTEISVSSFTFSGFSFAGFIIPKIFFNTFFSFILIAFLQSVLVSFISWLIKR